MQPQHQEWGEGRRRDDYTVPSTLPEPPSPSTGFPLPTSLGPGMWKKPWESIAPIYFFLRSWEQRGQNHFPRGLVVSPTQAKWNHSMEQSGLSQPIISP